MSLMFAFSAPAALLSVPWPKAEMISVGTDLRYGVVRSAAASPRAPTLVSLTGALTDTLGCNATGVPDACYYAMPANFWCPPGGSAPPWTFRRTARKFSPVSPRASPVGVGGSSVVKTRSRRIRSAWPRWLRILCGATSATRSGSPSLGSRAEDSWQRTLPSTLHPPGFVPSASSRRSRTSRC